MSMRLSSGRDSSSGDQRPYLWLSVGLLILVGVAAALAVIVVRTAEDTSRGIAALALPSPGAARVTPTVAGVLTPVPPASPTAAAAPRPTGDTAWWFADVGQAGGFTTTLTLFNPGETAISGTATYVGEAGPAGQMSFVARPRSRLTLGAPVAGPLAVSISGSGRFFAERMAVGSRDTAASGGTHPATTWYLPLVNTRFGFDDSVILANFNTSPARVSLAIFSDAGITHTLAYTVAASSRLTVPVTRRLMPTSAVRPGAPRGALVRSDQAIVVEQTTTLEGGGIYAVAGATDLAKVWYLPEGNTRFGFESMLAVLNPGPAPARLRVTYLPEGKAPLVRSYTVGGFTPLRLNLNGEMPDAAFGLVIEADQPVAVQRISYLGEGQAAHSSPGATATAREWLLPDVSTTAPAITFLVILNPGASPAEVTAYLFGEEGRPLEKQVTVAAASRLALALDRDVPPAPWSARVVSTQPVVVERVTYYRGLPGGASSMGYGR